MNDFHRLGRPRVAVLLPTLAGGGAERAALTLCDRFVRMGMQVDLVLGVRVGELADAVPAGAEVIELGARRLRSMVPAFARYLRRARPDAVLALMQETNCVAVMARMLAWRWRGRLVLSDRSNPVAHLKALPNRRGRWFTRRVVRTLYPRADALIAISQGVADGVQKMVGPRCCRITVIYNPVDATAIRSHAVQPVEHAWLQNGDLPVLIAAGNLNPAKDFPTLLRAFALLRQRRPARLIVLGEGRARDCLQSLAIELGIDDSIDMPGFMHNPWAWIARARLFVSSSRWEGFSMVIAEALSLGVPVVSTDCPSGPREILENGRYGTLVPVGNAHALALAIDNALDSQTASDALMGRAADFSPNTIARHYLNVLLPNHANLGRLKRRIDDHAIQYNEVQKYPLHRPTLRGVANLGHARPLLYGDSSRHNIQWSQIRS